MSAINSRRMISPRKNTAVRVMGFNLAVAAVSGDATSHKCEAAFEGFLTTK